MLCPDLLSDPETVKLPTQARARVCDREDDSAGDHLIDELCERPPARVVDVVHRIGVEHEPEGR